MDHGLRTGQDRVARNMSGGSQYLLLSSQVLRDAIESGLASDVHTYTVQPSTVTVYFAVMMPTRLSRK